MRHELVMLAQEELTKALIICGELIKTPYERPAQGCGSEF
jgi:hypothetical protein